MPEVTIELGQNSLRDADGAALVIRAPATITRANPQASQGPVSHAVNSSRRTLGRQQSDDSIPLLFRRRGERPEIRR
jgi:hypothetical protein